VLGFFAILRHNQMLSPIFESPETIAEQARLKYQTIIAFSNFLGVL
jgi:hypothetical protein